MIDPQPSHGRYTLRPVRDDDESWMWPAGKEALRPYVAPFFGWEEEVARGFFDRSWRKRQVVEVDGQRAGWIELAIEGTSLYLHEIGLLPEFRNAGLGSRIIDDVCQHADAQALNVELQVLVTNPAQRLYERMGFRPAHFKMFRPPGGWKHEPPREPVE
ncbi:MAG: GNAT family N-acetyltransferase [Planctomycetota bacterium]